MLQITRDIGFLSKPGSVELVQMQLALHSATPRISAFYSYYEDRCRELGGKRDAEECESWVDWYGEVVCDGDRLAELAGDDTLNASKTNDSDLYVASSVISIALKCYS